MPATVPLSVTSALQAAGPSRTSTIDAGSHDTAGAFDSHLDAARQQGARTSSRTHGHADDAGQPADASRTAEGRTGNENAAGATAAATPPASKPAANSALADDTATAPAHAGVGDDAPDAGALSVAGAMLALLGQAMPASASAATGGAAKVMAASSLKTALLHGASGDSLTDAADAMIEGEAPADTAATADAAAQPAAGFKAMAQALAGAPQDTFLRKDNDGGKVQDLAGLLATTSQASTAVPTSAHTLSIASQPGSAAFVQDLGQQVAWLSGQDVKQAKIRLHPEDLGQLDVKVNVQHNGQVDVTFAAQHPAAVHALQQTLPQLDALLAQHGLSLGQASVGQQQSGGDGQARGGFAGSAEGGEAVDASIEASASVGGVGLLDAFA